MTGVAVFSRPVAAAAAPVAAAEESGVVTSPSDRRPAMGDKVTISAQPRNTDFLQPGQVGTVVEVDDMDAEDVWFTVEDADGETDEYCEADLVLAAAVGAPSGGSGSAAVGASPPPSAAPAGGIGAVEIAASAQQMMAKSTVKGLFDSDDEDGGGLFD